MCVCVCVCVCVVKVELQTSRYSKALLAYLPGSEIVCFPCDAVGREEVGEDLEGVEPSII